MWLWLNRSSEVSLREQLIVQVRLAILCQEILPGHRLPSTRELARRFGIHANTASSAYQELEQAGWLEFRHGSGVYVRATRPAAPASPELAIEHAIDQLIGDLLAKAHKLHAPSSVLNARLRRWLSLEPPGRWLLIEPDPELRQIVLYELEAALALPIVGCTPGECSAPDLLAGAMPLVLPSKAAAVRKLLPADSVLTVLQVHPVSRELQAYLQRYLPEHSNDLVGIASRWSEFQRIAQTMLIAIGLRPETLLVRDATQPGWKRGLTATSGVVCDVVTASDLPKGCFPMVFRLLAAASIQQLQEAESAFAESVSRSNQPL
jgi:GntR family transcriptional regulator